MALNLNHNLHTYVAVTLSPNSPFFDSPSSLSTLHPLITHVGQVGSLDDVQLVSVPKEDWSNIGEEVLAKLKAEEGVQSVSVQELKTRTKRGGDEL